MEHFRHVLSALDMGADGAHVTEGSRKALNRAIWIARRTGASLTVLHSVAPDEYWSEESDGFIQTAAPDGDRRARIESALPELAESGLDADIVIRRESAWQAIIQEVLRRDIDVVVAAKRTQAHSDARHLGTVAQKLLRMCPCAVWLEDARESRDPSVIMAATDLTEVGDRAVALAASVATALDAKLHVIHAYSLTMEAQLEGGEARLAYEKEKRATAIAQIRAVLAADPGSADAGVHVGLTSPTQAVLEGIERLHPGLVVMGTISRGGIPGFLIGNTAERLIDRIDCALLTVKPKDFVCPVAPGETT